MPQATNVGTTFPIVYAHRERALFLVVAGLLVLLSHAADVVQAGGPAWAALGARSLWCLMLLATAAVVARGQEGAMRRMAAVSALGTIVFYVWLVALTGGARSHVLSFVIVLAMSMPLVMPELMAGALAASLLVLAAVWIVLWRDGATLGALLGWGHVGLVAIGIAWLLAHALRRARLAELLETEARLEAQARLVESELRRAEAERLAALGHLAGEIAHQVNNPLAAAHATATYLRDRLPEADRDAREAGQDLLDALDRIAEAMRRLRRDGVAER